MTEPAKVAVREAAVGIDWDRFLAVLARHRIEGLAHHALTAAEVELPPVQAAALARSAADILRKDLEFAAEAVRIDRALAGLPHLFVKGSTLAMLAYGTLGIKSAWDIDLVVAPEAMAEAGATLGDMGYVCVLPAEPAQMESWLHYAHETVWTHPTRGYAVELHSRLNDNPEMMPGVGLGSPRQSVQVGGGASLPTLAQPELFTYLCAHAARHAFSRLKWLADIAAFASVADVSAAALHGAAERLGAPRCSGTALLLANQVIGTPVDLGTARPTAVGPRRARPGMDGALGDGWRARRHGKLRRGGREDACSQGILYLSRQRLALLGARAARPRGVPLHPCLSEDSGMATARLHAPEDAALAVQSPNVASRA